MLVIECKIGHKAANGVTLDINLEDRSSCPDPLRPVHQSQFYTRQAGINSFTLPCVIHTVKSKEGEDEDEEEEEED